jgi:hypothetical protein
MALDLEVCRCHKPACARNRPAGPKPRAAVVLRATPGQDERPVGGVVPVYYRFEVKVPRTITHERRLAEANDVLEPFLAQTGELGDQLGPLLVHSRCRLSGLMRLLSAPNDFLARSGLRMQSAAALGLSVLAVRVGPAASSSAGPDVGSGYTAASGSG